MIQPGDPVTADHTLPLVSVVMTTFNGEKFLRQQVDSLLQQDYPNIEFIFSDDCSTDSTPNILREYAADHSSIRLNFNVKNLGYVKNFETAIKLSRGEYIALCDQDDIWKPDRISRMMDQRDAADIVYCDSELINEAGQSLNRNISDIKNLGDYTSSLPFTIGNCASGHAMLMKKQFALRAMPFPDFLVHDWWLAFCASCEKGLKFIPLPLVQYRQHSANILGAVKPESGSRKKQKEREVQKIRLRMNAFHNRATAVNDPNTAVMRDMVKTYRSFSLANNFSRMTLFLRHRDAITAIKKRSPFRKTLFCLKMFFKVI